jgi:two-component system, cell cycle response regulator
MDNILIEEDELPRILVADDEEVNRSLIRRRLTRAGYEVTTVENGYEAVVTARETVPDLIILDVMMPVMDGLQACRLIKEDPNTRDIPVIFLSARDETEVKVNGLSLGANDYISKPFKAEEFLARISVAIRLKRERDELRYKADEAKKHADAAFEKSMSDALTGLLNRYGLQRALSREQANARRYNRPLACLMIDIDNFKMINDTYGHMAGDAAITQVACILSEVGRATDTVCRYGGEEFLMLLAETDLEGALTVAEKIRHTTAARLFGDGQSIFRLTLSLGVAELNEHESGNDMIARADSALYKAKQDGRNRVEMALVAV